MRIPLPHLTGTDTVEFKALNTAGALEKGNLVTDLCGMSFGKVVDVVNNKYHVVWFHGPREAKDPAGTWSWKSSVEVARHVVFISICGLIRYSHLRNKWNLDELHAWIESVSLALFACTYSILVILCSCGWCCPNCKKSEETFSECSEWELR